MALGGGKVSVLATAANLTTLLGGTAKDPQNSCFCIEVENGGSTIIYEGPSTVTTSANIRGTIPGTAGSRWWTQPPGYGQQFNTDEIYLISSATVTAYVRLYR